MWGGRPDGRLIGRRREKQLPLSLAGLVLSAPGCSSEDRFARVDGTLCINLACRADRWQVLREHLGGLAWPFPPAERFEAVDSRDCAVPEILAGYAPYIGCLRSHLAAWAEAAQRDWRSCLVLEDDVYFAADFDNRVAAFLAAMPDDWDMFYLGGQPIRQRTRKASAGERVLRVSGLLTLHAYAVTISAAAALTAYVNSRLASVGEDPDFFRRRRFNIDRLLAEYQLRHPEFIVYRPTAWLAGQRNGVSDILGRYVPARKV